jgi:hypothetical protein
MTTKARKTTVAAAREAHGVDYDRMVADVIATAVDGIGEGPAEVLTALVDAGWHRGPGGKWHHHALPKSKAYTWTGAAAEAIRRWELPRD